MVRAPKTISKKLIATFLMISMLFCMSGVMANDSERATLNEIINHISEVNRQMGLSMLAEDIRSIEESVIESANQYCQDNNVTIAQAYSKILEEVKLEAPLGNSFPSTRSSGIGDTKLPDAIKGYIFYTDNDFAFNH